MGCGEKWDTFAAVGVAVFRNAVLRLSDHFCCICVFHQKQVEVEVAIGNGGFHFRMIRAFRENYEDENG